MFRYPIIILLQWLAFSGLAQNIEVALSPCNSNYNDFAPALLGNELVFCSDRPSRFGIAYVDAQGSFPTKIYSWKNNKCVMFSENIKSKLNEGPTCFNREKTVVIYTGTVRHGSNKALNKLGLFFSTWSSEGWSEGEPFQHNSIDSSYNIAHPSLNADGKTLYFSSDMAGGFGGKDLYFSKLTDRGWTKPVNLGQEINSSSNEIFPFMADDGKLYFSSDRSEGLIDYDVYWVKQKDNGSNVIHKMESPINSEFDDFSLIMNPDNESGYFASNRFQKNDNIYSFQIKYPEFENCPEAESPSFCYLFEETNIVPNDTMPMLFEWEFGDGKTAKGLSAEHCFDTFGSYHVALNIYDSLTKARFARVSEVDVQIFKPNTPDIDLTQNSHFTSLTALADDVDNFTPGEYFWTFGDGARGKGKDVSHEFTEDGTYTITLGIIGEDGAGSEQRKCSTKTISVGDASIASDLSMDEKQPLKPSALQEDMFLVNKDSTQYLLHKPDSTIYFVEFHQSNKKMDKDDPYFNNIKYEITERFDEQDTAYRYSVGHTTEVEVMLRIYGEMRAKGYIESLVREELKREFKQEIIKTWWFVPDSLENAISAHLNKFNDIRFDFGTYTIRKESLDNLDYISEVMILEKSLKLMIKAHTDSLGTPEDNMVLSNKRAQAVVNFLVSQGVNKSRLVAKGYGETMPVADNSNDEGRAQNRRVEFEIVIDDKKKKH